MPKQSRELAPKEWKTFVRGAFTHVPGTTAPSASTAFDPSLASRYCTDWRMAIPSSDRPDLDPVHPTNQCVYQMVVLPGVRSADFCIEVRLGRVQDLSHLVAGVMSGEPLLLNQLTSISLGYLGAYVLEDVLLKRAMRVPFSSPRPRPRPANCRDLAHPHLTNLNPTPSLDLKAFIRFRFNLEITDRLLELHCTLEPNELSQLRVLELESALEALTPAHAHITPLRDGEKRVTRRLDPLVCLHLVQLVFGVASNALFMVKNATRYHLPIVGAQLAGMLVDTWATKLETTREPFREMTNNPYLRMQTLFAVGTSSTYQREVRSLNLRPYLLSEFRKARRQLTRSLDSPDDANIDPRLVLQTGLLRMLITNTSIRIATYWLFALYSLKLVKSTQRASWIKAFAGCDYFSSQIRNVFYDGIDLNSEMRSFTEGLEKLATFFSFRQIVSAVMLERPVTVPYVSSGSGMEIRFNDVKFRHHSEAPMILDGVSFTIQPGTLVAIVGHNGSGKSTLLSLLTGELKQDQGEVLINSQHISHYKSSDLSSHMSITYQTSPALPFTIQEYVSMGSHQETLNGDRIRDALAFTGAEKFISALPESTNTYVDAGTGANLDSTWKLPRTTPLKSGTVPILQGDNDEVVEKDSLCRWRREIIEQDTRADIVWHPLHKPKTCSLSGGQWQRIALSRSVLKQQNDLIVLDEPSSVLDADSEAEFFKNLSEMRGKTTIVYTANRLSSTAHADLILVLSEGKIVEQGTHVELLGAKDGEYKRMWKVANLQSPSE